ncbi:hypothetical protein [Pseudomonas oryzihabitans]|uniref:hypothetical protein n=1 Tax=Pseudomonas oryzihabitans TaxID=47885 RepID=UPI00111E33E8|nr:hypothetical protein [Pseudomonas psychrotolerans]QDD89032.1 hypothetical protein CCZ28_08425 [Pseudomonas psychrotolerans]
MPRWTDQPATDTDAVFDFILEFSGTFLRRHASLLAKMLPPTLGFGMFLAYFARNHFYPSFDLFQFSSLLLAAACLGFLTIGAFVAALFLPGAWVYYGFINTPAIKEDITYALPYRGEGRFRKIMLLMALVFFVPYLLAGFSDAAILFVDPELFLGVSLLAPIPITLLAGITVQWLYELRRFSFLKFVWQAYLPTMVVGYFILWMLIQTYPLVEGWSPLAKWATLAAAPFAIAFVATSTSMVFIAGWQVALMFSSIFAFILAGYSGALTTLPETMVKTLGLGNYQAKAIVLDASYCAKEQAKVLPTNDQCVLQDVQVVWSLGEAFVLRLADDSTARLPASAIRALVKL